MSVGPDGLLPPESMDSVKNAIGGVANNGKASESSSAASDVGTKSQVLCLPKNI